MIKDDVERAVNEALKVLLEQDAYLLTTNVNERSISHRLAGYLEPHFGGWHVDCEYNRNHDDPKRLQLPRRNVPNDDTEARTVFPDIIVHRRSTNENLLVIEMKKTTSQEPDNSDLVKLTAFKEQLRYAFAVFVKVRTDAHPAVDAISWV
jgi:hypothetical protein